MPFIVMALSGAHSQGQRMHRHERISSILTGQGAIIGSEGSSRMRGVDHQTHAPVAGLAPALRVHGAPHVALGLSAARRIGLRAPVPLLSAPGAAHWLSPASFLAQIRAGRSEAPEQPCLAVLDCGSAAGFALDGIRTGLDAVILSPETPAWPIVAEVAAESGTALWRRTPPALDLRSIDPGRPSSLECLNSWLSAPDGGSGGDSPVSLR